MIAVHTKVNNYLKLVKFSHTIFAMPFAIIGYFLAVNQGANFDWLKLFLVVTCMVFARNAAMAFNRYADREIDLKNPRTAIREIPQGIIRPGSALKFVLLNSAAFIITTYLINRITFYLSPVALFVILVYSITKKFTTFCHFVLGLGLSLAPIGAYLAMVGKFAWLPLIFSFIVLFWVSGFDIIYALQDEEFDKTENLRSIPAHLGIKQAILLSSAIHIFSAIFVIIAGLTGHFNIWYWTGAVLFVSLLFYQHILIKSDDLSKLNQAFFTSNGIASLVFAIFTILSLTL
jgi:putative 4-hydroxybenzoate polyprenyltransferase